MSPKIDIAADLTDFFFDRRAVLRMADQKKRQALNGIGRFTRQNARQDKLRRRKNPSRPPKPPSVHSRDRVATLRNIRYAAARDLNSVTIGPLKLNQVQQDWIDFGSITVPEIHEKGAMVVLREQSYDGVKWRRRDLRRSRRPYMQYRKRRVRYAPRPFMVPAMEDEAPKFPELFKG